MKLKKLLAMLGAVTMMVTSCIGSFPAIPFSPPAITVSAAEETADGWQYTVYDNTVTITGYTGSETALTIPATIADMPVVAIGYRAFAGNTALKSLDLGSVQRLGYQILDKCTGIKSLTIPKTVTEGSSNSSYGALEGSFVETVVFEEGIANIPAYICKNASSVTSVVLPEKADTVDGYEIGQSAFLGTSITSVTLPASLTKIRPYAFEGCALLTEIVIPDNVEFISARTFSGCKRLKSVKLGEKVNHIYYEAFADCISLTEVDLANVEILDYRMFSGCSNLKSITIPKTVTEASQNSSYGCLEGSSVETVVFEEGISIIPAYICKNASSVTSVVLPEKADTVDGYEIGQSAFLGTSITSVTLPASLTKIRPYAFEGCALLTEIVIPDNVEFISAGAFSGCKRLKSVKLGEKVNHIYYEAFADCISLTEVDLANVEILDYRMFSGCSNLKSITIPKTVTEASQNSSYGCLEGSSIETVVFEEGISIIPAYICKNASSVSSVTIPEKKDTVDGYKIGRSAFLGTSLSAVTLPASLTAIDPYAFEGCALLTEIVIPDNVEYIGAGAFTGCKRLSNVTIGEKVNHIYYEAFADCSSLSAIDLGNVEILDYRMFSGCGNLKEITIPKTVTEASQNSSYGCLEGSAIETVTFEDGISIIPAYICKNASSVSSVTIPEKKDTVDGYKIGRSAFLGTSLSAVTLPESLTAIDPYAFEDCALLTEIVVPDNVEYIGAGAFSGCKRLRNVKLGEKVNHIYYEAFQNCTSLSKIDLRNVEILDYRMFSGCSNLKELTIPKTVREASQNSSYGCLEGSAVETLYIQNGATAIPSYLAKNCESLKTVYIPETCETIYNYAFANCKNLSSIVSDRSTFLFYSQSFSNCPKLEDSRLTVFDLDHTSLTVNSDQASVNGIVNYTLKYKLMPSLAGNVSNMSISLSIPESLTLLVDSVQSKNIEIDAERIQNGNIPVSADEGELRFSARVTQVGNYTVSASAKFRYNNSDWNQSIGTLDVECPKLTLAVPETVNELTANVYGIAQKGETVSVYVNNNLAGSLTANSYTGKYQGAVVLPAGKNGDTYEIYAKVGEEVSETAKTVYAFEKPVVKQVIFGYNQHATLDITDVLIRGVSPVVSFNPAYPTSYEITATNNEKIDRMFVTSTKGDKEKYIEAFYNAETGTWIAKGYFDPANHSYVPGTLNISIIEKTMTVLDSSYDYNQDQTFAQVPEGFKENSSVEIISETKDSVHANITVSDGTDSESFQVYSNQSSDGAYINGSYVTAEEIAKNPAKYGYTQIDTQTVDNGKKSTYYVRTTNNEDAVATMLLESGEAVGTLGDIWSGASLLELIEGDDANNPVVKFTNEFITETASQSLELMFGSGYSNIAAGLSFGSDVLTFAGQLQLANGDTEYTVLASVLFAAKCFNTFGGTDLVLASMGIVPPFSTLIKAGINMLLDYADDALIDWIKSGKHFFGSGHIRFIIDPSGIICEAVVGNTVEGATVTIYYQDKDGNPVKWNAEDYDQKNPLQTDEFGQYLWDVPEGKWKVICEMAGYETVESEWLDIPPIRTDVNLFITSKAAPTLVAADLTKDGLTVKFSKFMDITTVTASVLTLEGFDGTFTVSPKLLNDGDVYADTFILNGSFTDTLKSVSVTAGAVSYAGTAATAGNVAVTDVRYELGDANRDGAVNLKDAVVIRRYIAEGWDTEIDLKLADVNGDGTVNLKDAVMLRRYIAGGWNVTFQAAA